MNKCCPYCGTQLVKVKNGEWCPNCFQIVDGVDKEIKIDKKNTDIRGYIN